MELIISGVLEAKLVIWRGVDKLNSCEKNSECLKDRDERGQHLLLLVVHKVRGEVQGPLWLLDLWIWFSTSKLLDLEPTSPHGS